MARAKLVHASLTPPRKVEAIVIHCSATRASQYVDVKMIDTWHRAKGWRKIGYHYVIRRDGAIEKGRSDSEQGAHVSGFNARTIGICLVGGLNDRTAKAENNYTKEQFTSLTVLLGRLVGKYPGAVVLGHRDYSPDKNNDGKITPNEYFKDCPCFDAPAWAKAKGFPGARYTAQKGYKVI